MPKLLNERPDSSSDTYRDFPREDISLESLSAMPSFSSTKITDDDLLCRSSVESVSTLCFVKDHVGERLLEESDDSAEISSPYLSMTRLKLFCASQPTGFILNGVWTVILVLIPSFLRPRTKRKLHPTSYLDGLRGIAAFCVVQVGDATCPISLHLRL